MKTIRIAVIAATVVLILVLSAVNPKKTGEPLAYNPANEVKTSGTVEEVQEFYCPVTDDRGAHVKLHTSSGTVLVHVAIARFLRSQEIVFNKGDRLEVVGSKLRFDGKDSIIAREIARGDERFFFRDPSGNPLWAHQ
jgi:DNA/RNA endonuclease YhcR with UshA esterase domain